MRRGDRRQKWFYQACQKFVCNKIQICKKITRQEKYTTNLNYINLRKRCELQFPRFSQYIVEKTSFHSSLQMLIQEFRRLVLELTIDFFNFWNTRFEELNELEHLMIQTLIQARLEEFEDAEPSQLWNFKKIWEFEICDVWDLVERLLFITVGWGRNWRHICHLI